MARYEHLPIYKSALDLCVHFEKLVAGFSRYHKGARPSAGATSTLPGLQALAHHTLDIGRLARGITLATKIGLAQREQANIGGQRVRVHKLAQRAFDDVRFCQTRLRMQVRHQRSVFRSQSQSQKLSGHGASVVRIAHFVLHLGAL